MLAEKPPSRLPPRRITVYPSPPVFASPPPLDVHATPPDARVHSGCLPAALAEHTRPALRANVPTAAPGEDRQLSRQHYLQDFGWWQEWNRLAVDVQRCKDGEEEVDHRRLQDERTRDRAEGCTPTTPAGVTLRTFRRTCARPVEKKTSLSAFSPTRVPSFLASFSPKNIEPNTIPSSSAPKVDTNVANTETGVHSFDTGGGSSDFEILLSVPLETTPALSFQPRDFLVTVISL